MKTIDKIKNLIVKLGGTPSESPRIKDQVDCLCSCQFGAKSWNDLSDKPFYSSGRKSITNKVESSVVVGNLVKISDLVIPRESLLGATGYAVNMDLSMEISQNMLDYSIDNLSSLDKVFGIFNNEYNDWFLIIAYEAGVTDSNGNVYPESGIYCMSFEIMGEIILSWEETVPLEEKYLPESANGLSVEIIDFLGNLVEGKNMLGRSFGEKIVKANAAGKFPILRDTVGLLYTPIELSRGVEGYGNYRFVRMYFEDSTLSLTQIKVSLYSGDEETYVWYEIDSFSADA